MLLALIAPLPLYVASAKEDLWADPEGEFKSILWASPAYELHGLEGLTVSERPELNKPVMGSIGYHIRTGVHNVTAWDRSEEHTSELQSRGNLVFCILVE